jgi:hypothetical protein
MPEQFLLHLADGTRYGPVDRATLASWHREGRLPADTLVWPEGAPEWLPVGVVLQTAAAPVPLTVAAPAPAPPAAARGDDDPDTRPRMAAPVFDSAPTAGPAPAEALRRPSAGAPAEARPRPRPGTRAVTKPTSTATRTLLLTAAGVALVLALLVGLWMVLRPVVAKRWAMAEVRRHALADRRVEERETGLALDLPTGWVALRPDNPFVVTRGARVSVAEPALRAFGAIRVEARPQLMSELDRHLDALVQERLPIQPSLKEISRADVQLGRGRGRLTRTTWEDGLVPMQGAIAVWADGYNLYSLDVWAPASAGDAFRSELEALARGIFPSGALSARLDEAVERLALDVPELSRDALRLLVAERMSRGAGIDDVPADALRRVSRGLDALTPAEAEEMRGIYAQVWAPVPEAERARLARLLESIKVGRPVPAEDVQALRGLLKAGVLALPEEQRVRLQALSERAVRKSLLLP